VVVDDREAERFRRQAASEGLSLSAWLRRLGRARIEAAERQSRVESVDDLKKFWELCDSGPGGREPDWDEHLAVIQRSRGQGNSET